MTQEDKELLLKDLCARLAYGVKINLHNDVFEVCFIEKEDSSNVYVGLKENDKNTSQQTNLSNVKPYLRPMSSMTVEEECEFCRLFKCDSVNAMYGYINWVVGSSCDYDDFDIEFSKLAKIIDWLNKNHFDYRELIKKGLALEAPKDMYNN